jgi:hypothetical protein
MIDPLDKKAPRIAVSPEHIAEHDLLTNPREATDRRSLESVQTLEAEATPVGLIRGIDRSGIGDLPRPALPKAKAAEPSERDHLLRIAKLARSSS